VANVAGVLYGLGCLVAAYAVSHRSLTIMYLGYFFNALGRVFWAWVSDMLGRSHVYFLLYTADFFGAKYMGGIYGWILLAWGAGAIPSPPS
jgi:hypothetical protein